MAQAGMLVPGGRRDADAGVPEGLRRHRRRAVDRGKFSTFSAHIANIVADGPVAVATGAGAPRRGGCRHRPVEGGALGVAIVENFRRRGARRSDHPRRQLKTYAATTEGVASAAFGFDPDTFAPDVPAALRRAGTQPRHRGGGTARSESVDPRRGTAQHQRARSAAGRTSGQGGQRHTVARPRAAAGDA